MQVSYLILLFVISMFSNETCKWPIGFVPIHIEYIRNTLYNTPRAVVLCEEIVILLIVSYYTYVPVPVRCTVS